jgi:hypothetical protein
VLRLVLLAEQQNSLLSQTPERREKTGKKTVSKETSFLSYFLFLTASEVNNEEDLCQGKEK